MNEVKILDLPQKTIDGSDFTLSVDPATGQHFKVQQSELIELASQVTKEFAEAAEQSALNAEAYGAGTSTTTPSGSPEGDIKVYNVSTPGTYTNFGGLVVTNADFDLGMVQLRNENGVWKKYIQPIPGGDILTRIEDLEELAPGILPVTEMPTSGLYPIVSDALYHMLLYTDSAGKIFGYFVIDDKSTFQDGAIPPNALREASIDPSKLSEEVVSRIFQTYESTGITRYPLILDAANKYILAMDSAGRLLGKFEIKSSDIVDKAISRAALSDDVAASIMKTYDATGSIRYALIVTANNKVLLSVDREGWLDGKFRMSPGSVDVLSLAPDVSARLPTTSDRRIEATSQYDVAVDNDDLWRGVEIDIPAKTEVTGYGYSRFAPVETPCISGVNDTGTALLFCKLGIPLHGNSYKGELAGTQPSSPKEGYFWNITADGTYGGLVAKAGDRLLCLVRTMYVLAKKSEYFLMGECNPSVFAPTAPRLGDVYIASAAGTFSGIVLNVGDVIAYNGAWGKVSQNDITIANGTAFFLQCKNANEWAVRRVDKATTSVVVAAKGQTNAVRRLVNSDYVFYGDSMPGYNNLGAGLFTALGVMGTTRSFGGYTSSEITGVMRNDIRTMDIYAGRTCIFWHGHNNATDTAQQKAASFEMSSLLGSKQKRFTFWSMSGTRAAIFDGTKLVLPNFEDIKAKTGPYFEMEQFYEAAFPKQFFNVRKALLASAVGRTTPDPQFPGLTEEQVAATYGYIPFSYWFTWTGKPFTPTDLVFKGYTTDIATLPTGTLNDYYIKSTGGGTSWIGNLVVKISSGWKEYDYNAGYDTLHFNPVGVSALITQYQLHNQITKI